MMNDQAEALAATKEDKAHKAIVTVDIIVFDEDNRLLLIKRKYHPFQGYWALPGGKLEANETLEVAAARELFEETGLEAEHLELVGVYSDPLRDWRGRTVGVCYEAQIKNPEGLPLIALLKPNQDPDGGAQDASLHSRWENLGLAFDHRQMVDDCLTLRQVINSRRD